MKRRGILKDKRGLELAINTIVILVLALVLLAALVLFLTGNFSSFFDKVRGYSGKTNVDLVIEGCNVYAEIESRYSYCCEEKKVKYFEEGETLEGKFTCVEVLDRFSGVNELNCGEISC